MDKDTLYDMLASSHVMTYITFSFFSFLSLVGYDFPLSVISNAALDETSLSGDNVLIIVDLVN